MSPRSRSAGARVDAFQYGYGSSKAPRRSTARMRSSSGCASKLVMSLRARPSTATASWPRAARWLLWPPTMGTP